MVNARRALEPSSWRQRPCSSAAAGPLAAGWAAAACGGAVATSPCSCCAAWSLLLRRRLPAPSEADFFAQPRGVGRDGGTSFETLWYGGVPYLYVHEDAAAELRACLPPRTRRRRARGAGGCLRSGRTPATPARRPCSSPCASSRPGPAARRGPRASFAFAHPALLSHAVVRRVIRASLLPRAGARRSTVRRSRCAARVRTPSS